jgi:hypothetical protein
VTFPSAWVFELCSDFFSDGQTSRPEFGVSSFHEDWDRSRFSPRGCYRIRYCGAASGTFAPRKVSTHTRTVPAREREWMPVQLPPVSTPAVAVGALALGALAVGALAIGALAVGRLEIRQARLRKVEIDDLTIRRLRVIDEPGRAVDPTATPTPL